MGGPDDSEKMDVLIMFSSYGLLLKSVENGFLVPDDWDVLHVSASQWFLETEKMDEKYEFPAEVRPGIYRLEEDYLICESGEVFKKLEYGIAKVIEKAHSRKMLRTDEKAEGLFKIPASCKVYYILHGNNLEQYLHLNAPVEEAYVIISNAPGESKKDYFAFRMAAESPRLFPDDLENEDESAGRKLIPLGKLKGLEKGLNLKAKELIVERRDLNIVEFNYRYPYNWEPADYCIEIKTNEELIGGMMYVYANVFGKSIPIKRVVIDDIKQEELIYISKSWQVYHSWLLKKATKMDKRVYVGGELRLKGKGPVRIIFNFREINKLVVPKGKITKESSDYAEVELEFEGEESIYIEFDYHE
ncbi:hypothetical protein [Fervidobacterium sp.]